jgi:hypothetical protein
VVVILLLSLDLAPEGARDAMRVGLLIATAALLVTFTVGLFLLSYDIWNGHVAAPRQSEPAAIG